MMKQYDFPRIFQNVVGEVIPPSLRHRDLPLRRKQSSRPQEEMSSSCNTSDPPDRGNLYVHSKKKKLVRRLKLNKTSSCFSAKNGQPQEDKLSQNGISPLPRNFLKRKQLTLQKTDKLSSRFEKDEIFEKTAFLEDDMRSNQAQGMSSHRISNPRQRTSFDHHSTLDKKKNSKDTQKPFKQRVSQNAPMPYSHNSHDTQFTVRSKPKHRTFFKYDLISEEKSHSKVDESSRKKSNKKTVNFVINSEKENQQEQVMRTESARRGTKVQRTFVQKSSKFNNNKDPTANNGSRFDLSECQSNWSAKSVVSIKFTSTRNIKINSKRTIRSQQSIFQDTSHFMIKLTDSTSRYRTRTYIKFPHQQQVSLKNYKSLTSLSEVSIDLKSDWSINKNRRRQKRPHTNKSLASSKKVVEKQGKKVQNKVSILIKSNDPYLFTDSQRTIDPIKSSTFQELVFKRNNTLFKAARTATDPDIFNELNNFHKFLHQNSIEDNDNDLQRTLTKPIVIDTAVGHRQIRSSRLQTEENLMFDMGLTLLKKMSVLRQKKL